jgi:hypothetical protein
MDNDIGDVAVDKKFPGKKPCDLMGRHPAVGTADPQVPRRLQPRQFQEKLGVLFLDLPRPTPVVIEQIT